jgi:hypothetical protein
MISRHLHKKAEAADSLHGLCFFDDLIILICFSQQKIFSSGDIFSRDLQKKSESNSTQAASGYFS